MDGTNTCNNDLGLKVYKRNSVEELRLSQAFRTALHSTNEQRTSHARNREMGQT